jgi:hypothetical protein
MTSVMPVIQTMTTMELPTGSTIAQLTQMQAKKTPTMIPKGMSATPMTITIRLTTLVTIALSQLTKIS